MDACLSLAELETGWMGVDKTLGSQVKPARSELGFLTAGKMLGGLACPTTVGVSKLVTGLFTE